MIKVSACIPHHNYFNYIQRTLESLGKQSHRLNEIVICDDVSDNGDYERLVEWVKEEWPQKLIPLKVIRLDSNPQEEKSQRIPYARNRAFEALDEEPDYVFFPDADDMWGKEYVNKCVAIMEKNSTIDFVYPQVTKVVKCIPRSKLENEKAKNATPWLDLSVQRRQSIPKFDKTRLLYHCFISYCSVIRTSAFLKAGMWPENHFKKEYVFWNTLAQSGSVGEPLIGPHFYYFQHAGQRHNEKGRMNERHHRFNAQRFIAKKFGIA